MKRRGIVWGLGFVALFAAAVPLLSQDGRTINSVILQGRAWTYSALQTFGAGVRTHALYDATDASGPSVQLDGSGTRNSGGTAAVNLLQLTSDYTMANPTTAPTIGTPSGVSGCLGTKAWQFGAYYYNKGGLTAYSPMTANQGGWATSKTIPVIRPADFPPTATHWTPVYIDVTAAPTVVKNCTTTGPITAIGTASANCTCAAAASDVTGQANTTATRSIMQVLDGELRFPSFAGAAPNLMTEGARRFNFGGGFMSFSPDSGVTLYDVLTSNGQSRIVCATCRYTTVDLALASISDNAIGKPYTIYALPGTYGGFTMSKSYVYVVGLGAPGSVIFDDPMGVGVDVTDSGVSNVSLFELSPAISIGTNTVPTRFFINNSRIGRLTGATCTIDILHEAGGGSYNGRTWFSSGSVWQTCWDGIFLGRDTRFVSSGDLFIADNTDEPQGANNLTMFNWISDAVDIEISGATFLAVQTKNISGAQGIQLFKSAVTGGNGSIRPRISITGSRIYLQSTHASTAGTAFHVLHLSGAEATTINPEISFTGTDIDVVAAGTTADLIVFNIDADADHDGWIVSMTGGSIRRSGGDTANSYDIDNAETASGFAVEFNGVRHDGKYTGAGTTRILNSPLTSGVIRNTPLGTAPATCSIGDRYTDTSGADCYCSASNTWQITNATGSCV